MPSIPSYELFQLLQRRLKLTSLNSTWPVLKAKAIHLFCPSIEQSTFIANISWLQNYQPKQALDLLILCDCADENINKDINILAKVVWLSPFPHSKVHRLINEALLPYSSSRTCFHGVMLDVFDRGVLIRGPSGVGKTQLAIELLKKGHRLVAEDMVSVQKITATKLVAQSPITLQKVLAMHPNPYLRKLSQGFNTQLRTQIELELIVDLYQQDCNNINESIHTFTKFSLLSVFVHRLTLSSHANLADTFENILIQLFDPMTKLELEKEQ